MSKETFVVSFKGVTQISNRV